MAVDLQLFFLGIVLLMAYSRFKIQTLVTGLAIVMYCLHGVTMEAILAKYALSLDVQYEYLDQFYTSTRSRIYVYVSGLVAGYYLATQKNGLRITTVCNFHD